MESGHHHPSLPALSELLARQVGLHFPQERWPDLMRGLHRAAPELHCENAPACITQLLSAPLNRQQIETLARHLTIGETYFFREPQVFEALQNHVLPALIDARRNSSRHLRLWSAGCSTGEEAYSLAILLQRTIPDFQQWNITILATDINPQALEKAAAGVYGEWSFRNAPPWLRENYFRQVGTGSYEILPGIRDMVSFAYLNLAQDTYPSLANNTTAMDIVLCRNVLMYFEPGLAARVVGRYYQALVDNGWLVVSPSEITQAAFSPFAAAHLPGAILHQKTAAKRAPSPSASPKIAPTPAPRPISVRKPAAPRAAQSHRPSAVAPAPEPDYRQALELYRQGRYPDAAATASRLLEARQNDTQALALMARINANCGELPAALRWCEQAVAAERLNPSGHYLQGAILQELGRAAEAMLAYKRALYLDPDFVLAQFALGNLYRDQHKPRQAAKHFDNALLLLARQAADNALPEADGLTAGRLMEIIRNGRRHEERAA